MEKKFPKKVKKHNIDKFIIEQEGFDFMFYFPDLPEESRKLYINIPPIIEAKKTSAKDEACKIAWSEYKSRLYKN